MKVVFVSWFKFASRSESIARAFNGQSVYFASPKRFRMLLNPFLYLIKSVRTLFVLYRERPDVVFAMNPATFLPLTVYAYSMIARIPWVIDSHSAAFDSRKWTWLSLLHRFLAGRAAFSLVTATRWADLLRSWGAKSVILDDPPMALEAYDTGINVRQKFDFSDSLNICFVSTFADDEPLNEVLAAARQLSDVRIFITGSLRKAPQALLENSSKNVTFTDYLDNDTYFSLLSEVDVVMVLTDRENTMQNGGMEAIAVKKPLITSNTRYLRETFYKGTIHVDHTVPSIADGVQKMRKNLNRYREEIKTLKKERDIIWEQKKKEMIRLIQESALKQK